MANDNAGSLLSSRNSSSRMLYLEQTHQTLYNGACRKLGPSPDQGSEKVKVIETTGNSRKPLAHATGEGVGGNERRLTLKELRGVCMLIGAEPTGIAPDGLGVEGWW